MIIDGHTRPSAEPHKQATRASSRQFWGAIIIRNIKQLLQGLYGSRSIATASQVL